MATKKRARDPRTRSKSKPKTQTKSGLKTVPNEVAARYRDGQEKKVCKALAPFGKVQTYPRQRMVVLKCIAGQPSAKVDSALHDLQAAGLLEFVTPVLLDRESNTRQVLTDEIVLRLKPGRTERTLEALKNEHGLEIGSRNEFEPSQYIVKVPKASGTATLDVARSLDRSDDVEFASPNFITQVKR
jgi:hypothetical protein